MNASATLLELPVNATNLPTLRTHARQVGEWVGLEGLQHTRFCTAVSEIARNAVQHGGGGQVRFTVDEAEDVSGQRLVVEISDHGPGIADIAAVLEGRRRPDGRMPLGILAASRLVDQLHIEGRVAGGVVVRLAMALPDKVLLSPADLGLLAQRLAERAPVTAYEELEQQNRELLRALHDLREKQAELQRADERKNQFVATLAHELRNPLSTLQMTLDILRRKPVLTADELAGRRDVMERQTRQLTQMVDDLLDAARVSQGKVLLQMQPVELNALLAESVEMSGGPLAAREHQVTLRPHPSPLWVSADASRLKQVFCNLLQNSARYTPLRGQISLEVQRDGQRALVAVRDNGIGISATMLPHVFGLFVQGDATGVGHEGGLGVGLALVRRLVHDHRGSVTAASDGVGQGSCFHVSLPLVDAPA